MTTEIEQGDTVKVRGKPYGEETHKAIVTQVEDGQVEAVNQVTGEKIERTPEECETVKQSTNLCMIGRAYGVSQSKEKALANALQHANNLEDGVQVWMAEVDRNNWNIRGMGQVYSPFIDNEQEFELNEEKARDIRQRARDLDSVCIAALGGYEPHIDR